VKWDLQTGSQQTYDFGPNSFPGEFVFVQDDDAAGEDEGWVIGFVYDAAEDSSDLVILDGSAPGTDPVARVHLPQRVPFGFHGSWVDDSIL
jgi:carotenoid cleavage dioxygenase-like enzyme